MRHSGREGTLDSMRQSGREGTLDSMIYNLPLNVVLPMIESSLYQYCEGGEGLILELKTTVYVLYFAETGKVGFTIDNIPTAIDS